MEVTKVEQRSYVKIAVLRGRNARECHAELRDRTMARWVEAFKRGRVSTADLHCSGRSVLLAHKDVSVTVIKQCLMDDRRWTVTELAQHTVFLRRQCTEFYGRT
jgi:hypothetical protein